jgi:hypothetical protein
MNPEELLTKDKEELINELQTRNILYDEVMAEMVMIREELLTRLKEEKKDGEIIGEFSIKKSKRVTFKTTLEEAEPLGAVKKAPDNKVLKQLHDKGIKVPGVKETIFLSVRRLEQEQV